MKLFLKRHYTSLTNTRRPPSIPSQIIQLCRCGLVFDAIGLLNSMNTTSQQSQNIITSKPILYATIIQACTKAYSFTLGLQLHCYMLKSGLETDRFVGNSLLSLYFKLCPDFSNTRKFFDGLYYKDVVSWTSIISGYIRVGKPRDSIGLYLDMLDFGIEPNAFTLSAVIRASAELRELHMGRCLHAVVIKFGFGFNNVIISALIDMYGRNHEPGASLKVFDEMLEPDFICWTSVISALTRSDLYAEALQLFYSMHKHNGFSPDGYTFGSVLTASGNLGRLKQGKELHSKLSGYPYVHNESVSTASFVMTGQSSNNPTVLVG
ncbi:unnamed protein product [Fraxinus pennsylvanica]|uniref:Pentatricopeptide repeat-containing protein n=1 Tax=Fraxinus pennsylvanica TaxID=56036 RepID=A0AAD2EFJ1_9LAMI|nr:unnamed protein product [Fraxinus pennsylvanica]